MNSALAIRYKLAAVFAGATVAALIRAIGPELPVGEIIFFRAVAAIFILVAVHSWRGELSNALQTNRPFGHFIRGAAGAVGMFAYVAALARLPIIEVTVIFYAAPIMTIALAAFVLDERIHIYRWSAVIVGFVGVIITMWPHLAVSHLFNTSTGLGAFFAFLAALLTAVTAVQIRRLTETETTSSIVFYFYVVGGVAGALTLPFQWVTPTFTQWTVIIALGIVGTAAQLFQTQSYRHGATSLTAAFDYTGIVWAFLFGYIFFGELPTVFIVVGGAIIIASGLFMIWRERKRPISPKDAKAAPTNPPL